MLTWSILEKAFKPFPSLSQINPVMNLGQASGFTLTEHADELEPARDPWQFELLVSESYGGYEDGINKEKDA